jgi:hypothetical protein
MKRLETTSTKDMSIFSRVRRVITTSVNSLLTLIKMFLSVGFVIIAVVILGALFAVLVLISNYRNGTQYRVVQTWKDLLTFLMTQD